MRLIRGLCAVALVGVLCAPAAVARAQQPEQPPLEDVTLRGRILRPDGSPLANSSVRVDAKDGFSFFSLFAFAFTGGLSALSCFDGPSELCPVPGAKSYFGTTDANGRYSFTFPEAKRRGEQTNTDYFLSVGMPSSARDGGIVVASYELELLDPVHDAPDMKLWDPSLRVRPRERSFALEYDRRGKGSSHVEVRVGDRDTGIRPREDGGIEARAIEDVTVQLVPHANEDVTSKGTIYHQRFVAAAAPLKGPLVPLSRGAPCVIKRADGAVVPGCPFTDGDIVTPAVADENPCSTSPSGRQFRPDVPCVQPVTEVTVDLGAPKEVGEVRTRCACAAAGSTDGVAWRNLPTSGEFGSAQTLRYVRVTSQSSSLGPTPEISVWPPWDDETTQLADPATTPLAPPGSGDGGGDGLPVFPLVFAIVVLGLAAYLTYQRLQRARREGAAFA